MAPDADVNDAFSVVSGRIVTPDGAEREVSVLTPTVFGGGGGGLDVLLGADPIGPASGGVAWAETTDGALTLLAAEHPGARWAGTPELREATPEERDRALAEGVNERFVAAMSTPPPRRGREGGSLLRRLFGR